MTGFEPATTRPPGEYSTGLSYIPIFATVNIVLCSKQDGRIRYEMKLIYIRDNCRFTQIKLHEKKNIATFLLHWFICFTSIDEEMAMEFHVNEVIF